APLYRRRSHDEHSTNTQLAGAALRAVESRAARARIRRGVGKPSGHAHRRQPARRDVAGRSAACRAPQTGWRHVDERTLPRTERFTDAGNTITGLTIWLADAAEESELFVDCRTDTGAGYWREHGDFQCGECGIAASAAL